MSRTLLLGLDGASFTALDPMMDQGVMPFLKGLVENGVRAPLMSTPCPVTPPAWTSMMTGRSPGHHSIFDFITVDDSDGSRMPFRLMNGRDIRCEPLWSFTGRHGKQTGVLNFPATYLCAPFNGYLVPGFVTSRVLRTSVHPREFWERVKVLPGFDVKDASWDLDEGRKPLSSGLDFENLKVWIDYLKRKEQGWYAIARELIEGSECELVAVVFEGVDRLQHQLWNLLEPAYFPENPTSHDLEVRECAYGYYRHLDNLLRQLVEAAGPDARTFVVSDHGFGSTTEIFYVNTLLEKLGYLRWKKEGTAVDDEVLTAHNMREHFESIDWEHTIAYARTTSANGIYIRGSALPPEQYAEVRDKIEAELLAYKDPRTGTPVITKTMRREDVFPGEAMNEAPDLTLTLRDGGFVSIMNSKEIVKPRSEVKGTHRPDGIFIAAGAGVERGMRLAPLSILDVAPTLLYSMDLPVPEEYEGRVAIEAFDAEHITAMPIQIGGAQPARADALPVAAGSANGDDENVILERLKSLGYME